MITRAEHGPMSIQMSRTAREVIEFRYVDGHLEYFVWPRPSESYPHIQPPAAVRVDRSKLEQPWELPPDPTPRTYFNIDRFTDTSRVVYASNDIIVHCPTTFNQPFYSVIRPSDRGVVRQYIEAAKEMSPVKNDDRRPGGYLYAQFHVLKASRRGIPDLPPKGEHYPQGTDESERLMPGQQFIPVEASFLAGSDGLMCIIERLDPGTAEDLQSRPARDGTSQECWARWAEMADRNSKHRKDENGER
ncbi:hypothetical protein EHS25_008405 [Saitozyma podzolica]|uniref:Uncharacterized protein n=1 Tax=Saitozyma podzolica TaxID=1890683 RepID=A0A427YPF9_9TREE|nr:hypothetical protein EHS25_008405 [Saitozyma podzolica]